MCFHLMLLFLSGIGTSSVYCFKPLLQQGFPFECERRGEKVLVVKTHGFDRNSLKSFERVILIIRNPFNALLAFFNYAQTINQTGYAGVKSFFSGGK